jgi:hypothetical protein
MASPAASAVASGGVASGVLPSLGVSHGPVKPSTSRRELLKELMQRSECSLHSCVQLLLVLRAKPAHSAHQYRGVCWLVALLACNLMGVIDLQQFARQLVGCTAE